MVTRNDRVTPETEVRSPARSFAQSLESFYTPARDVRSEQSLQRGLSGLSALLGEKLDAAKQQRNQNEATQGVQDALREAAGEELQGVKGGSIFRQHSKFYMAGLNETRGKAAGAKFKNDIALAYQEWDGRHIDDDGTAFREWMNGKVAEFMGTLGDDQYKIAGALPIINEVANNFAVQHTAFTSERLEQESNEAYDEVLVSIFDDIATSDKYATFDEFGDPNGVNWDRVVEDVAAEANDRFTTDGAAANDRVVEAAIRYSNTHNDPDAIFALARAHDSGKLKLSLANQEKLANAADAVEADIERETSKNASRKTAEEKARQDAALNAYATLLKQDPYAPLPDFAQVGDHATYAAMVRLQESFEKASQVRNPTMTNAMRTKLDLELAGATSLNERIQIITEFSSANPGALSPAETSKYTQDAIEKSDPNGVLNKPVISSVRISFGESLGTLQTDEFDINKVTILKTQGQRHYDDYIIAKIGSINANDGIALRQLAEEAEEYAIKQLTRDHPELIREGAERSPGAANFLGVNEAIAEQDAEIAAEEERKAQEALKAYEELATGEGEGEAGETPAPEPTPEPVIEAPAAAPAVGNPRGRTPSTLEGVQGSATGAGPRGGPAVSVPQVEPVAADDEKAKGEALAYERAVAVEPPPFDDPKSKREYSPVRETFYGQLINRFTDGKDDRPTSKTFKEIIDSGSEFGTTLVSEAEKRGLDPQALLAVMSFETGGTFSPSEVNKAGSGATGLIQFMPRTAKALGTTTEKLARMSQTEQLTYVFKYLDQFKFNWSGMDVDDVYMSVLYPKAAGKPDGYVLFRSGTTAYSQNAGLDSNRDGTVTKLEAAAKVRKLYYS